MTKLKTLKDIPTIMMSDMPGTAMTFIHERKLKEEAIKWYHRSDGNKHKFIKEFFNLTDEEIKNDTIH